MLATLECRRALPPPSNPVSHVRVLPGSCELLSHTPLAACNDAGLEVGLQLCALGASWSPVITVSGAGGDASSGEFSAGGNEASRALRSGRPLLLRAVVPDSGVVLDIVVRIQVRVALTRLPTRRAVVPAP